MIKTKNSIFYNYNIINYTKNENYEGLHDAKEEEYKEKCLFK